MIGRSRFLGIGLHVLLAQAAMAAAAEEDERRRRSGDYTKFGEPEPIEVKVNDEIVDSPEIIPVRAKFESEREKAGATGIRGNQLMIGKVLDAAGEAEATRVQRRVEGRHAHMSDSERRGAAQSKRERKMAKAREIAERQSKLAEDKA